MNCLYKCVALFVVPLCVACTPSDNSSAPAPGLASALGDSLAGQGSLLQTGANSLDIASSWFCTYTQNGVYVDRKQLHLFEDGAALVDGVQSDWSFVNGVLTFTDNSVSLTMKSLEFFHRLFLSDNFSAIGENNRGYKCDWVGPVRPNAFLLDDDLEANPTSDELTGDGIDTLLVTGNAQNSRESYWQCESPVDGWSQTLRMFSDGTLEFGTSGTWRATSVDEINVMIDSEIQVWSDVIVPYNRDVKYDYFSATMANRGDVACRWSGVPRAAAYK